MAVQAVWPRPSFPVLQGVASSSRTDIAAERREAKGSNKGERRGKGRVEQPAASLSGTDACAPCALLAADEQPDAAAAAHHQIEEDRIMPELNIVVPEDQEMGEHLSTLGLIGAMGMRREVEETAGTARRA